MGNTRYSFTESDSQKSEGARLLYVSSSNYEGEWASIQHSHYFVEIFFVKSGTGKFEAGAKSFPIMPGDLVIVNPEISHTESSLLAQPLEYIVLGIDGIVFDFGEKSEGLMLYSLGRHRDEIMFYLHTMLNENENKPQDFEIVSQALLEIILTKLSRIALKASNSVEHRQSRACGNVKRYIASNYALDLTLERLAEMAHLSKYYLVHSFTKEYGLSPISYLNEVRIKTGKELLESTDYSIGQIAQSTGFSSQSYFSQSFKNACGQTPAEYRKAMRAKTKEVK